jgi:CheY-specific phosphatase CheX
MRIDHVLESINSHYEVYRDLFMEEHRTGKYKRFSDNPYYEEVKAIIDAMNVLRKYLGWETISLKKEVEFYLNW